MPSRRSSGKHAKRRETPTWVRIGVTALVLAFVIIAVGVLANLRAPAPAPASVPAASVASSSVAAAPSVTTSTASATSTVAVSATGTAPSSPTSPGGGTPLASDAYNQPISDLASLLPKTVTGYTVGLVETSTANAIVPLRPASGDPLGKVTIVVLTVFDKKTVAGALSYVDKFPTAYSKDLGTVTLGTLSGRFGTDGTHLAAIVFSRGRYAFEIVGTVTRGAPRDVKQLVIQAAQAFGATRTAL
jgi:hypothetical protein